MTDLLVDTQIDSDVDGRSTEEWRVNKHGRQYVPRDRGGVIFRQGEESIEEARARDAKGPEFERPKKKKPAKPPAPTKVDLKQLEHQLIEELSSPAMLAAMAGDRWAADHFTREAPNLARNLTVAAEHNPWLRAKLEAMLAGEGLFTKLFTVLGVGGALVAYAVPPLAYYNLLPFMGSDARELFGVPDRAKLHAEQKAKREQEERDAAAAQAAQAAQAAAGAERAGAATPAAA